MRGKNNSTIRYFLVRLIELLITLLLVSFMTFAAFSIIPGDAASVILGPDATPAQVENLRQELGLDKPLYVQYFSWLLGAFTGNLGKSAAFGVSVSELIAQRLPVTLGMSVIALIMVVVISYPTALISARRPGRLADQICSVLGHVLFAIPPFVLSLVMILLTSSLFGLVTVGRYTKPSENFFSFVGCLLLPSFCIALPKIAMTFKFLRSTMIEQNASDHVRTAKSHGLSDLMIEFRHVLPNSNVSAITVISLVLSDILGGSLIVEQVFNLPGLGRLLLTGIARRDFPLLSGMILYLALITVLLYFLADILTAIADPRIRIK
ncbi:peptide/nickel transport system permease protein [Ruminococcaceae bacterium YRB3002]|nr:peptide/nickel transport system permease protein [Ruminococcaceae bacterium YRB3002]